MTDLYRVPNGALERLEPCARKRARTVLRGRDGGNAVSLLGNYSGGFGENETETTFG